MIYARDSLDSPILLFGKNKFLIFAYTIIWQSEYDAYGDLYNKSGTFDNLLGYCGEYFDSERGLEYLCARTCEPSMGTFISEDLIKAGDNWYMYCNGNPLNYVDPWKLALGDSFKTIDEAVIDFEHEYYTLVRIG